MSPKVYSTIEVAARAKISRQTLQTWIANGRIKAPELIRPRRYRLWSAADLAEVMKEKPRRPPRKGKRRRKKKAGRRAFIAQIHMRKPLSARSPNIAS
jgi:excisionase family DNA binding protein